MNIAVVGVFCADSLSSFVQKLLLAVPEEGFQSKR